MKKKTSVRQLSKRIQWSEGKAKAVVTAICIALLAGVVFMWVHLTKENAPAEQAQIESSVMESSIATQDGTALITFNFGDLEMGRKAAIGDRVTAPNWEAPAGTYIGWKDEEGTVHDLAAEDVDRPLNLTAVLYPETHFGTPFMLMKDQMLHPEQPLSGVDMAAALKTLVVKGEILSETLDIVPTAGLLSSNGAKIILEKIFPANVVEPAFAMLEKQQEIDTEEDSEKENSEESESESRWVPLKPMSRLDFALVMEQIRETMLQDAEIYFYNYSIIPMDIDLESEAGAALVLASIPYTFSEEDFLERVKEEEEAKALAEEDAVPTEESSAPVPTSSAANSSAGSSTASASKPVTKMPEGPQDMEEEIPGETVLSPIVEKLLSTKWTPGKHMIGGYLYQVDEEGDVLRHKRLGYHLFFNDNGRYTTGSYYLDHMVADQLMEIIADRPEGTYDEWLKDSFDYVVWHFNYTHGNIWSLGDNDNNAKWFIDAAVHGLRDHVGVCYEYAAAFTSLARGIGYDAHCVAGLALGYHLEHCWVMMRQEEGGALLCYDPQLEWRGTVDKMRYNFGIEMFAFKQNVSGLWQFIWHDPETTCTKWNFESTDDAKYYEEEEAIAAEKEALALAEAQAALALAEKQAEESAAKVNEESSSAAQNAANNSTSNFSGAAGNSAATAGTNKIDPAEVVAKGKEMLRKPLADFIREAGIEGLTPVSKEYSTSCYGSGQDGKWTYEEGFILYTYKEGNTEILLLAQLAR